MINFPAPEFSPREMAALALLLQTTALQFEGIPFVPTHDPELLTRASGGRVAPEHLKDLTGVTVFCPEHGPVGVIIRDDAPAWSQINAVAHEWAHIARWTPGQSTAGGRAYDREEIAAQSAADAVLAALGIAQEPGWSDRYTDGYSVLLTPEGVEEARASGMGTGRLMVEAVRMTADAIVPELSEGFPLTPVLADLRGSLAAYTAAGLTSRACIMEVHAGQKMATMLQATAHNLATVVADLAMVNELAERRGDVGEYTRDAIAAMLADVIELAERARTMWGAQAVREHPADPAAHVPHPFPVGNERQAAWDGS